MAENQMPALPTDDQAVACLQQEVSHRVFFQKLAQAGRIPATEEEAVKYLQLGDQLLQTHIAETQKSAAAAGSDLDVALSITEGYLVDQGLTAPAEDVAMRKLASAFAQDPRVVASILSLAQ